MAGVKGMLSDPLGVVAQIRQIDRGIRSEKALLYSFLKSFSQWMLAYSPIFLPSAPRLKKEILPPFVRFTLRSGAKPNWKRGAALSL